MRIFELIAAILWVLMSFLLTLAAIALTYWVIYDTQWVIDLSKSTVFLSFIPMFITLLLPLVFIAYVGYSLGWGGLHLVLWISDQQLIIRSIFWTCWLLLFPFMVVWALITGSILVKNYLAERFFDVFNDDE